MLFADEVRPSKDVESAGQKSHKPSAQQLEGRGLAVIEELSGRVASPATGRTATGAGCTTCVSRKRKGETGQGARAASNRVGDARPDPAALEQTLAEMRG